MNILFSLVIINFLILIFHKHIAKYYNIYDVPDKIRKFHLIPVPLTGGLILISNFLFINYYTNQLEFYFLILIGVFIVGVFDDKFNLNPNKKLIYILILSIITVIVFPELQLKSLRFAFIPDLELNNTLSYLLPAVCILIFVNAINMFDGANLQVSIYASFIFIILFYFSNNSNYLLYLIPLITFSILNIKNKSFLGDSGSIFLGFYISLIIIKNYNLENLEFCEEIFLIMYLPGIEMIRVFIERIYKKKNPFEGDRNHIHHLFQNKFKKNLSLIFIILISIFPFLSSLIIGKFLSLVISIFFYFFIIFYLKKV